MFNKKVLRDIIITLEQIGFGADRVEGTIFFSKNNIPSTSLRSRDWF